MKCNTKYAAIPLHEQNEEKKKIICVYRILLETRSLVNSANYKPQKQH